MQLASLQRVKRREKILLVLAFAVAISVFRSVPGFSAVDPRIVDSIAGLQPLGVDGRVVPVLVFKALFEFARQVFGASIGDTFAYSAAVFGAMTAVTIYFVYRELFGQRYIGVVALALAGSAPAFVLAAAGAGMYVVGLFFTALAALAWLKQRWVLWGIAIGLAISSHYAATTLIFATLGWMLWSRKSMERPGGVAVGAVFGAVIVALSYYWTITVHGGLNAWAGEWLATTSRGASVEDVGLASFGVEHVAYLVVYVLLSLGLVGYFRDNAAMVRVVVAALVIGVPFMFLLSVNGQLLGAAGVLLWAIALASALPLWIVDARRTEIVFLLTWLAPLVILTPLLTNGPTQIYLFAVLPLALLACRLLDRTLDGEWLDFWWALGLSTNWYYRVGKLTVLLVLALSYVQAARLAS